MFFQCPWLPEFMLTAQDVALFDGCFRSGPIAPRNKGAVSDEDIERFLLSSQAICVLPLHAHFSFVRTEGLVLWDNAIWMMFLMCHACPPDTKQDQGSSSPSAEVGHFLGHS